MIPLWATCASAQNFTKTLLINFRDILFTGNDCTHTDTHTDTHYLISRAPVKRTRLIKVIQGH